MKSYSLAAANRWGKIPLYIRKLKSKKKTRDVFPPSNDGACAFPKFHSTSQKSTRSIQDKAGPRSRRVFFNDAFADSDSTSTLGLQKVSNSKTATSCAHVSFPFECFQMGKERKSTRTQARQMRFQRAGLPGESIGCARHDRLGIPLTKRSRRAYNFC